MRQENCSDNEGLKTPADMEEGLNKAAQEMLDLFFNKIYPQVKVACEKVRQADCWPEIEKETLQRIETYKKIFPFQTPTILAIAELVSKENSSEDALHLLACLTEKDIAEFKEIVEKRNFKLIPNEK